MTHAPVTNTYVHGKFSKKQKSVNLTVPAQCFVCMAKSCRNILTVACLVQRPRMRGGVKRGSGAFKSKLKRWIVDNPEAGWIESLPEIVIAMNISKHKATIKALYLVIFKQRMGGKWWSKHDRLLVDIADEQDPTNTGTNSDTRAGNLEQKSKSHGNLNSRRVSGHSLVPATSNNPWMLCPLYSHHGVRSPVSRKIGSSRTPNHNSPPSCLTTYHAPWFKPQQQGITTKPSKMRYT